MTPERLLEINTRGPRCGVCDSRPDDPVWAYDRTRFDQAIMCLGCVADARAAGRTIVVTRRAIFRRDYSA